MSEVFEGIARIERLAPMGMVTLRGDLSAPELSAAIRAELGCDMPDVRRITTGADGQAAWMSPDELLLFVESPRAPALADRLDGLKGGFFTAADVSGARVVFSVSGAGARDVLAKACPVDFADFPVGSFRRTRAAQVAAAIWRAENGGFMLTCMRSVADYAETLLHTLAHPGAGVGLYRD
jgi:sarcosine oxidase subunit gamma